MAYDSKWWSMRSGDLVGSNSITQEISDSIKKFFSKKDGKAGDIFLIILALVAFHFGIHAYQMLVGKFMGDMPTVVRIIVNLIPMAAGCYLFYQAFFNKFDSKVYMESAAGLCILLMSMTLSALSPDIDFLFGGSKWMVYLMLFTIPVVYLATSTVGAFMYMNFLITWLIGLDLMHGLGDMLGGSIFAIAMGGGLDGIGMIGNNSGEAIFGWFFLLLILPHFMRYTDRPSFDTRKLVLGWAGGGMLLLIAMGSFTGYAFLALPFLLICFYMAGKEYYADGKFWWNRPFQTMAIALIAGLTWSLTYAEGNGALLYMSGIAEGATSANGWFAYLINLVIVLGVIAWGAYTIYNDYKGEKKGNMSLMMFPGVMLLILIIDRFTPDGDQFIYGIWAASLYAIYLGADYLMKGLREKNYQLLILGLLIGLPILMERLHDLLEMAKLMEGDKALYVKVLLSGGLCAGLLYLGNIFYKSTRPNEE